MAREDRWIPPPDLATIADLVEPCSECGAPCRGTVAIWFVRAGSRHTIEVDTPTLGDMLLALVHEDGYERLPALVRDWNEGTGWDDVDAPRAGTPVPHDDMLATLALLGARELGERERQICAALQRLTVEAQATAAPLFIRED